MRNGHAKLSVRAKPARFRVFVGSACTKFVHRTISVLSIRVYEACYWVLILIGFWGRPNPWPEGRLLQDKCPGHI